MSLHSVKLLRSVMPDSFKQMVRYAGIKKKMNYSDNQTKYRPSVKVKSLRGFQFDDGEYVYKGDILVRQMGLDIYPGESVKLDRETWNLVALCNGRFTITTEELNPYSDSPLYHECTNGKSISKPFVHVISEPVEPIYKIKRLI